MTTLRHTYYKLASTDDYAEPATSPIYTPGGQLIAYVSPRFAYDLSIEGSGKLSDGRVVNFATSGGTCQTPAGYQGVHSCYRVLDASRYPWGSGHNAALEPLRSIAVDPRVIPWNSRVYIREFDGLAIPRIDGVGGFTHDGWFRAEDSGGAIHDDHIDIFAGPTAMYRWLDRTIPTSYPRGPGLHADIYSAGGSSDSLGYLLLLGAAAGVAWWYYRGRHRKARRRR